MELAKITVRCGERNDRVMTSCDRKGLWENIARQDTFSFLKVFLVVWCAGTPPLESRAHPTIKKISSRRRKPVVCTVSWLTRQYRWRRQFQFPKRKHKRVKNGVVLFLNTLVFTKTSKQFIWKIFRNFGVFNCGSSMEGIPVWRRDPATPLCTPHQHPVFSSIILNVYIFFFRLSTAPISSMIGVVHFYPKWYKNDTFGCLCLGTGFFFLSAAACRIV